MIARLVRRPAWWLARQARADQLDDPAAVVLAGAAGLGAWAAIPVPVAAGVAAAVLAVVSRRVVLVWCAAAVLTTGLAAQAWSGLHDLEPGPFRGTVTLARDPEPAFGAWRVEVVAGDHRLEAWARGAEGARLRDRAAGQRVELGGRIERVGGAPWLAARHVAGRLVVDEVGEWEDGHLLSRAANGVRSLLRRGAEPLDHDQRALFLGFVLGDVRDQPPEVADDFDAAGLQHLLVVSGQNVAFVLTVVGPALTRMGQRSRLVATAALLCLFATITRYEPSVLRATVMAALAVVGATIGRPVSGVRVLALTVAALLVADPFLVHAMGFRLSVAASAGILVLSGPVARALPGPRAVAVPLAVTLAAQAAVAPVLVPVFGPMPVAAIPANLLAGPVAGLVMMWGCSAGVVAGLVGGPVATVLHWPTGWGIGWVAGVAQRTGSLPLGQVGVPGVLGTAAAFGAVLLARRHQRTGLALVAGGVAAAVLLVPGLLGGREPPAPGRSEVAGGEVWHVAGAGSPATTVLVLDGDADPERLLHDLRAGRIRHLDLVVSRSGGTRAASAVDVVGRRLSIGQVWAPVDHDVHGAATPRPGTFRAPGVTVDVVATSPRLEVEIALDGDADTGGDH
jgi:competence protein ComEC